MSDVLDKQHRMPGKALLPFLALTFGLTWGLAALFLIFTEPLVAIFGEPGLGNPLVILAVYAPGIAGVVLVLWHGGVRGLGSFLRRLTLWRAPGAWWLFLVLGIPAIVYFGAAIKGTLGDPLPFTGANEILGALATALLLGPIEEFGWRGLALPLLQRRVAPFWAGLILGIIWALWHIPSLIMGGMPQSTWSVAPYLLGIVAISLILTPFFNAARGSLLVAVLYHFQMMNPLFPDAQPYDNLLWIAVAIFVVIIHRRSMFQRRTAVTSIYLTEETATSAPGNLLAGSHSK